MRDLTAEPFEPAVALARAILAAAESQQANAPTRQHANAPTSVSGLPAAEMVTPLDGDDLEESGADPPTVHLVVDPYDVPPGPLRPNPWTVIHDPALAIRCDLVGLEGIARHLAVAHGAATQAGLRDRAEIMIERLAEMGVRARLEPVQ